MRQEQWCKLVAASPEAVAPNHLIYLSNEKAALLIKIAEMRAAVKFA
jgi:hypothetical protein